MSTPSAPRPARIREYVFAHRPDGIPDGTVFDLVERRCPDLALGEILVENAWFSIDASMRLRMDLSDSPYLTPYEPGDRLDGWAIGRIVETRSSGWDVGQWVFHYQGWRDIAILTTGGEGWVDPRVVEVDADRRADQYLGVLGPSGLTSWAGLVHVATIAPGDIVYVSAAAGAVGGLAIQIAKFHGNVVVGSASTDEKVRYVTEVLGADAAFNYRTEGVTDGLARVAPDGIDVYFDNVGEDHLDSALKAMRPGGRIALCGAIAAYNSAGQRAGLQNIFKATERGLTLRGFLARMFGDRWEEFYAYIRPYLARDEVVYTERVVEGLEHAPQAFIDLLNGVNTGKTLVRL